MNRTDITTEQRSDSAGALPAVLLASGFYILITLICSGIPFFWDTVTFSKAGDYFFTEGISTLIVPLSSDTGSFPLYGLYIALMWNIFGQSLMVSHLAFLPLVLGLLWQFYLLCRKYLPSAGIYAAFVLLLADPVITSQSVFMAYDIILAFFFLGALNALLEKKYLRYSIFLVLLIALSVRGIPAVAVLLLLHLCIVFVADRQKTDYRSLFLPYLAPLLFFSAWAFYHQAHTGWFLFSPLRETTDEYIVGPGMSARQFIYILWKLADLGRVLLWILVIILGIWYLKKILSGKVFVPVVLALVLFLIVHTVVMVLFSNPVGHRYFVPAFLLLDLVVVWLLRHIASAPLRYTLLILAAASMICGNFWMYPERYGNGWDVSLKSLPFFESDRNMERLIQQKNIKPSSVATDFPLFYDRKFWYPGHPSFAYTDKAQIPIDSFRFVLHSNISNKFHPDETQILRTRWIILHTETKGQVYMTLYANPSFKIIQASSDGVVH